MYFINAFKNEQSVCCFKSLSGSNFTVAIAGNNQNMNSVQNCTDFICCSFPAVISMK